MNQVVDKLIHYNCPYTKATSRVGFGIVFSCKNPNTYLKIASHMRSVLGIVEKVS